MSTIKVPPRSEIKPEHTWNAPSVYATAAEWEAEFQSIGSSLADPAKFSGHLGESPSVMADALQVRDGLIRRLGKLFFYANMSHQVDTGDSTAAARWGKAQGLFGQALGAMAFIEPELLTVGELNINGWVKAEARLAHYAHYFHNLFRKQAHVRSGEVEELLGMLVDPFGGPSNTAGVLVNADFKFAPGRSSSGEAVEVTQGSIEKIKFSPDRQTRRTGWNSYFDKHLEFKTTLATNLTTSVKQNIFQARARRHPSSLAASLFDNHIPVEVFHNLIGTFKKNLPTWHRYWAIRRKALKVDELYPYDIWAPLSPNKPHIPFEQAVEWVCAGLAPLGDDYTAAIRKGCLEDRWVDIYPNVGKASGAFSYGSPGTHPFINMSYDDGIEALSTLAHELGHSLHSYLTWQAQPTIYSDYSLFVAEVASNFHQAMTRGYLLKTNTDREFQISIIEEAMSNFHRYFFIMPTLARFELEMHERLERGEGLTADDLNGLCADLFSEGYGGQMTVERDRVGITWATFQHLYADYYVYQYATGIAAANALSKRILAGERGAAENYRKFLQAGSSVYPMEALKIAGVDMTTPAAVEEAFSVLAGMVDRLEKLVA